jgi:hypothetical protein
MDADNSFDDQYLDAQDIFRLIEALDRLISRPEAPDHWRNVPSTEKEYWSPYRRLRARLMAKLGMRMWDDTAGWIDVLLREERNAAWGAFRREVERLLTDPNLKRADMRLKLSEFCDNMQWIALTKPRLPGSEKPDHVSRLDREREPYTATDWRRQRANYGAGTPETPAE